MKNFKKGIYDLLLKQNELESFDVQEIIELKTEDDEWLVNQFSRVLKEKISQMVTLQEKVDYFNNILNNKELSLSKAFKKGNFENNLENISTNKLIKKSLWTDLQKEFKTANQVKIISPFITRSTINKIVNILEENLNIDKLKIITTTYDGNAKFLDIVGLEKLVEDFPEKVEIKIENLFNKSNKRIHIKSYFFERENGFSSLYIGSSNFTNTGQITGAEYNVRLSEFKEPTIIKEFTDEFNTMFNKNEFIDILQKDIINQIKLRQDLNYFYLEQDRQKGLIDFENMEDNNNRLNFGKYYMEPYDYQEKIINTIVERINNKFNKHLLVMATGTGKTATMAFIYQKISNILKKDEPSMIYIAPSKEILDQTRKTFINITEIDDFGLEYYDSRNAKEELETSNVIFTNIESIRTKIDLLQDRKFDIVVFDEAHYVEATTFKEVYEILEKKSSQIFGLTATPERTDGINVAKYFGNYYAADIKLFEAIKNDLLSEFDYYFIHDDSIDLKNIDILKDPKLNKLLTLDNRNKFVFEIINKYLGSRINYVKAVLFCNSIEQAKKLSEYLNDNGLKSEHLVSTETSKFERKEKLKNFRNGNINFLCVRDILNEGVDVPEIDTIFFLRPTTSLIVYLQQLGRGLRKLTDKKLEVYDFVNNVDISKNKNYNPIMPISALTNNLKISEFKRNIDNLDKYLPGECNFIFSKIIKQDFLEKLREYEKYNLYSSILEEYRSGDYEDYESFFNDKEITLYDFYSNKRTYFKENNKYSSLFKQYTYFNNKSLIQEFIDMFKNKTKSKNELINRIFLKSFHYNSSKKDRYYKDINLAFEVIFKDTSELIIREIEFILRYKLYNEKLLDNQINETIESFIGSIFNHYQFSALCSLNISDEGFKGSGQSGILSNIEKKIFVLDTSTNTKSTRFGHGNFYDQENKIFYWDTPDIWKFNESNINDQQSKFMKTNEYKSYVFFADEELKNKSGKSAKKFIGYVTEIIDRIEVENGSKEKYSHKKPKFILKITD
ncbi:DEAD/DEAH box helicase family protein [Spiroplasma diminutum]|uniref:Type III restriction enzyme, res subunit n=1 Tax=Spiroplasma diminutum CUAS-1 TaxID=1276221 RepID=S5MES5_9MOLU|nr:DEAD/DEAH box helicase family protein [Spiroplasma diminutum]AGR42263.1 type III restriction enzyme, res subunit [Spiroplasma diminutum CUAS-1]